CDIDDGLQDHMSIELAVSEPHAPVAERVQILADTLLALVNPIETDLDRAVVGEEIGHLIPLSRIEIVAVGALQAFDVPNVLEVRRLALQLRDFLLERARALG